MYHLSHSNDEILVLGLSILWDRKLVCGDLHDDEVI